MPAKIKSINIYDNRSQLKYLVLVVGVIIAGVSVWYTNFLVKQLSDREIKLIALNASAYRAISNVEEGSNSTILLEIIEANNNIPIILTDEDNNVIGSKNIKTPNNISEEEEAAFYANEIAIMRAEYEPITLEVPGLKQFVYYRNSDIITKLRYYPIVQLGVIAIFGLITYLAFSFSRRAEQNRVWVGLAKETAHQLGTPLSSLMAWFEYFRSDPEFKHQEILDELDKDLVRLNMITARFSSIGSVPTLRKEDVEESIRQIVDYLSKRVSSKVLMRIHAPMPGHYKALLNSPLFDWVLENLSKNAVDAMTGEGSLDFYINRTADSKIIIDICDTGKGMTKKQAARVFEPGFTTKKRGWGLGLTLAKRIVEQYHNGKISVKTSKVGKGTTFRIILPALPIILQSVPSDRPETAEV